MARDLEAAAWLESRSPAAPPALLARMKLALAARADRDANAAAHDEVRNGGVPPLAAALAEAAVDRLRVALAAGDERAGAFDLLAADALLTYAFEAAADAGPDAVAACARAYGPVRLAELLEA